MQNFKDILNKSKQTIVNSSGLQFLGFSDQSRCWDRIFEHFEAALAMGVNTCHSGKGLSQDFLGGLIGISFEQ